ncbi:hypothetical protein P389DRAFT_106638 [Cystobasidium minutum MCA 4210]|uniref:uncharacterized protein n=1 Tax=Cystobasidium minutum MCA 4210 TaxID=1397322 RepID=UPI0034CEC421|eukprot:jgi/Rhomi1/106638/CE106637_3421
MTWRSNRNSSSTSHSKGPEAGSVNALLEASRQAQRREGSSKNSEDLQLAGKHRRQTAGPIPQSWSKEIVDVKKAIEARRSRRSPSSAKQTSARWSAAQADYRPRSLREECIKRFLVDMARGGPLLDEVAFLPIHIKKLLLTLAPKIAPLDDASIDALLLEAEDVARLDVEQAPQQEEDNWEFSNEEQDLPEERKIDSLDLSHSTVSLAMFRQVMLQESDIPGGNHVIFRLPMLRSLDLSASSFTISSGLLSILSHAPLRRLCLAALPCNLYLPLQSIALALPALEYLDVSDTDWMDWSHLTKLDWKTLFLNLTTLKMTGCEGLSPNASYLDPEVKSGGPAILLQAMNTLREAGRVKWLNIVA